MAIHHRRNEPLSSLHAAGMLDIFQRLGVVAAIWHGHRWRVLHHHPSVTWFEVAHGMEGERNQRTARMLAASQRSRRGQLARHRGLADLFVPIVSSGRAHAVLTVGPFMTTHPTASEMLDRWAWITGKRGHLTDPEFSRYVSATLATLVLDPGSVNALRRSSEIIALALGEGATVKELAELDQLRVELERPRRAEWMDRAVNSVIHTWTDHPTFEDPRSLGLSRLPDHALVGLCRNLGANLDPLLERVQLHLFQRASAAMTDRVGSAIVGKAGERGVIVLSAATGSAASKRSHLLDLASRLARRARDFGFQLHAGLGPVGGSMSLNERYQLAMGAAQQALSRGVGLIEAEREHSTTAPTLRQLRTELAASDPADYQSRFEVYLEALRSRLEGRLDLTRAHLLAAFERLADAESTHGALDSRSLQDLDLELDRATRDARSSEELFDAYRRAVSDIASSVERPTQARRDRTLRRAIAFIRQHYAEALNLRQVARIAGFAPSHFSVLFKAREQMTFESYLRRCRIERAKQLLVSTGLRMEQVAKMSGFAQRYYFSRVFKQVVGTTPGEYRKIAAASESIRPR